MGMDPSKTTIDPLNSGGRNLANNIFATMNAGGGYAPGMLQPGQAPAFEQLFGMGALPGAQVAGRRGPMNGTPNGNPQPGMPGTSGTRTQFSTNAGNFQANPAASNGANDFLSSLFQGGMSNGRGAFGGMANNWEAPTGQAPPLGGGSGMNTGMGPVDQLFGGPQMTSQSPQAQGQDPNVTYGNTGGAGGPFAERLREAFGLPGRGEQQFEGLPMQGGSFDLPGWQGPMGAGLTGGQLGALGGLEDLFMNNGNPLVNNEMIQGGLQQGMSGNPAFDPSGGGTLGEAVQPYELDSRTGSIFDRIFGQGGAGGSETGAGGGSRLNSIVDQIAPEVVSSFRGALNPGGAQTGQGTAAMDRAIDLAMAKANEQASGYGLSPGSIDRGQLMAGNAAQVAADLGVAQQNADTNAISRMNQDRVGALNSAGSFENLLNSDFRNKMMESQTMTNALPALMNQEDAAFRRMMGIKEPAAGRSMQTLGMLPEFRGIPGNELMQLFGVNDAARGVADEQVQRAMGEYGRTQGGALRDMIGALGGIPGINTAMGPSGMSQFGSLVGGAAQFKR